MTSSPPTGILERLAYARGDAESILSTLDKGLYVLLALAAADGGYGLASVYRTSLHEAAMPA